MKNFACLLGVLLFAATSPTFAQKSKTKGTRTLTPAIAQRVLNEQINRGSADNILFTCRACYDPDDKSDNDNFPLVTTYSPALSQFLARKGYIRVGNDGTEYFTAKAKRSPYFEAFGDGSGRLGGAGFRFSNFRNPKIMVIKITNPNSVPIQYEAAPTDVTREFFRTNAVMKTTASFTFEDGKWNVCIGCNGEETSEVTTSSSKGTVASDFLSQIDKARARAITLRRLTVVDGYALQTWTTEHMGGQALLRFSPSSGTWVLVSMGGGAWDADSLVAEGVPRAVAALLVNRSLEPSPPRHPRRRRT